jgi:hypothetical protein
MATPAQASCRSHSINREIIAVLKKSNILVASGSHQYSPLALRPDAQQTTTHQPAAMTESTDGIVFIVTNNEKLKSMIDYYIQIDTSPLNKEKAAAGPMEEQLEHRSLYLAEIIRELSIHTSTLQLLVYPLLKKLVSNGELHVESLLLNLKLLKEVAAFVDAHHRATSVVE